MSNQKELVCREDMERDRDSAVLIFGSVKANLAAVTNKPNFSGLPSAKYTQTVVQFRRFPQCVI